MFFFEGGAVRLIAGRRRLAQLMCRFQGIARDLVFQGKQPLTKEVELLVVHIVCGPLAVRFHRVLPHIGSTWRCAWLVEYSPLSSSAFGFTYLVLLWLEALGFCEEGESGPFVEGGQRISPGGQLPLNSNGGQLSEGRTHGFGHLYEAVLQLRGAAGDRQIKDARMAVAGVGGGALGGCVLITNQD